MRGLHQDRNKVETQPMSILIAAPPSSMLIVILTHVSHGSIAARYPVYTHTRFLLGQNRTHHTGSPSWLRWAQLWSSVRLSPDFGLVRSLHEIPSLVGVRRGDGTAIQQCTQEGHDPGTALVVHICLNLHICICTSKCCSRHVHVYRVSSLLTRSCPCCLCFSGFLSLSHLVPAPLCRSCGIGV